MDMRIRKTLIALALASFTPAYADDAKAKDEQEEAIKLEAVPAAVMKAFTARYPKAKATKAEKITKGKTVMYELAWQDGGKTREATFDSAGAFVEEE